MAKIILNVGINLKDTDTQIDKLRKQFESLATSLSKVKVDENFVSGIKALTTHYEKLAKTASSVVLAEEKLKQEQAKSEKALSQLAKAEQQLATEKEKTKTASERARLAEEKLADFRQQKANKASKQREDDEKKIKAEIEKETSALFTLEKQYASFLDSIDKVSSKNATLKSVLSGVREEAEDAWNEIRKYNNGQSDTVSSAQELSTFLKSLQANVASLSFEFKGLVQGEKESEEIQKLLAKAIADAKEEIEKKTEAEKEAEEKARQLREEEERLREEEEKQKYSFENLTASIEKAFGDASVTLVRSFVTEATQLFGELSDTLVNVENKVIELQRVLKEDVSNGTISSAIFDLAQRYGQTFDNVATLTGNFARAGYSFVDSIKASESALLGMNVAELNATQASEGLIAIMSQFGKEASDLELIIDELNQTADRNPVTTAKLLTALQRTGSSAHNANASLEKTISVITALSAATARSGQNLGTAINSLIMYSQKSLETFSALSPEVDAVVQKYKKGTADIFDIWQATSIELQKLKAKGGLGSALDLFGGTEGIEELNSTLHDEVEDVFDQANGIYDIANTYRKNYFIALLTNMDKVMKVNEEIQDAEGYSQAENEKYLSTYEAKLNTYNAKWQEFLNNEQGFLGFKKGLLEVGSTLIDISEATGGIVSNIVSISTLLGGIMLLVKSNSISKRLVEIKDGFKSIGLLIGGLTSGLTTATTQATLLQGALGAIGLVAMGLSAVITIINSITTATRKAREEAIKNAEATRESNDELKIYFDELLHTKERSEKYYEIEDKIVKLLGDKAEALDGLTKKTKDYSDAVKEMSKDELEHQIMLEEIAVKNAKASFKDVVLRDAFRIAPEFKQSAERYLASTGTLWSNDPEQYLEMWNFFQKEMEEVYKSAQIIKRQYGANSKEYQDALDVYSKFTDSYKEMLPYYQRITDAEDALGGFKTALNNLTGLMNALANGAIIGQPLDLTRESRATLGRFYTIGENGANPKDDDGNFIKRPSLDSIITNAPPKGNKEPDANNAIWYKRTGGGGTGDDPYLTSLKDAVALRKAELTLMGHQNASYEERIAKVKEIQTALHTQAEYMRSIGADEASVKALSSEWYEYEEQITKLLEEQKNLRKQELEDDRKLLQSRLTLMENQGKSAEEQIEVMQAIQKNLHDEADYLRQIKASETDINALSSEWWDWQEKILKLYQETLETARELELDEIQKIIDSILNEIDLEEEAVSLEEKRLAIRKAEADLEDAIAEAQREYVQTILSDYLTALSDAQTLEEKRNAVTEARQKALTAQKEAQRQAIIDALEAERTTQEENLSLAEKQLAVEEARKALNEAENNRTTRVYNESTGMWEYQADAKAVQSAQEKLADAVADLDSYLEGEAWNELIASINEGTVTERQMLDIVQKWANLSEGGGSFADSIIGAYHRAQWATPSADALSSSRESVQTAVDNLNEYLKNEAIKELKNYIATGNNSMTDMQAIMNKWLAMGEGSEIYDWSKGVLTTVKRAIDSGKYDDTKVKSQIQSLESAVKGFKDYVASEFLTKLENIAKSGTASDLESLIEWAKKNGYSGEYSDEANDILGLLYGKGNVNAKFDDMEANPDAYGGYIKALASLADKNTPYIDNALTASMLNGSGSAQSVGVSNGTKIIYASGDSTPVPQIATVGGTSNVDSHDITINGIPISADMARNYTLEELCRMMSLV